MADFIWTAPITYADKTLLGKDTMNAQFSENMRYLFRRPRDIINITAPAYTTTSTTLVAMSTTALRLNVTLQRTADLWFWFNVTTRQTGNSYGETEFDIVMDGTLYLSSLTGTPLSNGLCRMGSRYSNSSYKANAWSGLWQNISAGDHYFDLYWADDGSGGQSETLNSTLLQYGCIEV